MSWVPSRVGRVTKSTAARAVQAETATNTTIDQNVNFRMEQALISEPILPCRLCCCLPVRRSAARDGSNPKAGRAALASCQNGHYARQGPQDRVWRPFAWQARVGCSGRKVPQPLSWRFLPSLSEPILRPCSGFRAKWALDDRPRGGYPGIRRREQPRRHGKQGFG